MLFTVIPSPWIGITAIYGDPASLERDLPGAGSMEIRNFQGEQTPPDSHAGSVERDHYEITGADHCYLR